VETTTTFGREARCQGCDAVFALRQRSHLHRYPLPESRSVTPRLDAADWRRNFPLQARQRL